MTNPKFSVLTDIAGTSGQIDAYKDRLTIELVSQQVKGADGKSEMAFGAVVSIELGKQDGSFAKKTYVRAPITFAGDLTAAMKNAAPSSIESLMALDLNGLALDADGNDLPDTYFTLPGAEKPATAHQFIYTAGGMARIMTQSDALDACCSEAMTYLDDAIAIDNRADIADAYIQTYNPDAAWNKVLDTEGKPADVALKLEDGKTVNLPGTSRAMVYEAYADFNADTRAEPVRRFDTVLKYTDPITGKGVVRLNRRHTIELNLDDVAQKPAMDAWLEQAAAAQRAANGK